MQLFLRIFVSCIYLCYALWQFFLKKQLLSAEALKKPMCQGMAIISPGVSRKYIKIYWIIRNDISNLFVFISSFCLMEILCLNISRKVGRQGLGNRKLFSFSLVYSKTTLPTSLRSPLTPAFIHYLFCIEHYSHYFH